MKIINYFSCIFLCLASFLHAAEKDFEITYETISSEHILESQKYNILGSGDPTHHKTVIRMVKHPNDNEFVFEFSRPLLGEKKEINATLENLVNNGRRIGEKLPMLFLSSKGFLPGEKVNLVVSTKNGAIKSKAIPFFPQPLIQEDKNDRAKMTAELATLSPTQYIVYLEGFRYNEKLRFVSYSLGEKVTSELRYKGKTPLWYAPEVIGKSGAISRALIGRENGNRITLNMPWGNALLKHNKGEENPVISNFPPINYP